MPVMDHSHHHNHDPPPLEQPGTSTAANVYNDNSHAHHSSHNHPTYFNFNAEVTVLFSGWLLNTRTGMFAICLVSIILGMLYQGIKHLRVYIHRDVPLFKHSAFSKEHLLQTLLYGIQIVASNVLMLAVMTYNIWVFICILAGIGLGFFLIEWHRPKSLSNGCQNECSSKPMSRGTTVTRLSIADVRATPDQELEPLSDQLDRCENCRDSAM